GTDPVTNPFQPADGPLIPFLGPQGRATMNLQDALQPWALFGNLQLQRSFGFSRYDALTIQMNHRFSEGLQFNGPYTWSKSTDFTQTEEQSNGYTDTGGYLGSNLDFRNFQNNKKLSLTDVPQRFVVSYLYELPIGKGRPINTSNRLVRAIAGGWKTAGAFTAQSGFPIFISGANNGAANGRPDRVAGVPLEVPKELQHWYNGTTRVTLPSGRIIQPGNFTFLKYNPDAFQGRALTAPNGT